MATRYVNISIQEMRDFLFGKGGALTEGVQNDEIIFDFKHPRFNHIVIRIFSGIAKSTQTSRGCGQDALRVCAIDFSMPNQPKGFIKSQTAYRTKNWRINLRDRTKNVIEEATNRILNRNTNFIQKTPNLQPPGRKINQTIYSRPVRVTNQIIDSETQKELQAELANELAAEMEIARIEGSQI